MPEVTADESNQHAFAVQSAVGLRGVRTVLYMDELDTLDVKNLANVAAVHYRRKGFSSHAQVICQIKGIPLIRVDELEFTQGNKIPWPTNIPDRLATSIRKFPGRFQATIFDSSDLDGLDFTRIDTVFIRFEHLLYGAIAETSEKLSTLVKLQKPIQGELNAVARALPHGVTMLVRGLDVRSDDRVLAHYLFRAKEANPELGYHGTRYLLDRPDLVQLMADTLRNLPAEVRFACPFVTTHREYQAFSKRYSHLFDLPVIPFTESPSVFFDIARYKVDKLCIGLKDVAQFYFAADRTNPDVSDIVCYTDKGLLSAVASVARTAARQGTEIYLYQEPEILSSYSAALSGVPWIPSLAASELSWKATSERL